MAFDCQPQAAGTDVRPIFNGYFSVGRDATYPAEKHTDRLSWLHNSRLERKQPLDDGWSLKLYNGTPQKKKSRFLPLSLWGSYRGGTKWQQLILLAKRKPSFILWMSKNRTHWLSECCSAGIQKACISGFNLAYPNIHLKQYFHIKIECLDNDSSSSCAALCSISVYITMQFWLD